MRGYLTPNRLDLTVRQNRQYFYSQCGLCQQLKEDYGSLTRFLVNRDALLLQLLVEALQEQSPETKQIRCGVNPFLHSAKANLVAAKFSAAVTILMVSGKLQDTIYDGNFVYSFGSKVGLLVNKAKIKKAEQALAELGFAAQQIHDLLIEQQRVENLTNVDLEVAALPTATGLGLLFAHTAVLANRSDLSHSLQQLGHHLGKFIYILDARDDLQADIKNHQFNPLRTWLKNNNQLVDLTIAQANDWLEKELLETKQCFYALSGDLNFHQSILQNLFMLGLSQAITKNSCNLIPLNLSTQFAGDCCEGFCHNPCDDLCSKEYWTQCCCGAPIEACVLG